MVLVQEAQQDLRRLVRGLVDEEMAAGQRCAVTSAQRLRHSAGMSNSRPMAPAAP